MGPKSKTKAKCSVSYVVQGHKLPKRHWVESKRPQWQAQPTGVSQRFYLTSMVLMGIATDREGATNVRTAVGRISLEPAAPWTINRREAEERCIRHAAAENIIVAMKF